jgi:hypothetical protein
MLKKLFIISSIFIVVLFVAEIAVSFFAQNNIHPDYWKFGGPEKLTLFIIFAAYVLVVLNSIKRFKKVRKNE